MHSIHKNDEMYSGDLEHYTKAEKQLADMAHSMAHKYSFQGTILELPCGYGRVTRQLTRSFDPTQIHVSDSMNEAVNFCESRFGVKGHLIKGPTYDYSEIPDNYYGMAIMGSLITHFTESETERYLGLFLQKLAPKGIAIITTHGRKAYELMLDNQWFSLADQDRETMANAFENGRYAYAPYAMDTNFESETIKKNEGYGLSLIPESWLKECAKRLGFQILEFHPAFWDNHQDLYVVMVGKPAT